MGKFNSPIDTHPIIPVSVFGMQETACIRDNGGLTSIVAWLASFYMDKTKMGVQ